MLIGTKLAHYEITKHLGSGGMGDVYQATDSKLGRSVAIKLLPEAFTHDAERAARFEREARVLASLNHSNIATIYGVEESADRKFLVMELVGGETLAERIKRGPIPVDESLGIAKQICEALEAAHEKGIIHRDLKPANVKITPDGKVKVLDFGLAKAFENEPANAALSNSPTLSMAATNAGVILGTAAYMSPEQVKGNTTDARSDIWSFGVVLYEMLRGRSPFEAESITEILANVLKSEPEWTALPQTTPPTIVSLLRRCLQRDRNRRIRDIADARLEIEGALTGTATLIAAVAPARKNRQRLLGMAVIVALIYALVMTALYFRPAPTSPETRLQIVTPPGRAYFAISPDGRKVVFDATTDGKSGLWLRRLESEIAEPLAGTDAISAQASASVPFWSPDSNSVGFFADQKLKRIDLGAGIARTIADAPTPRGGAWNHEDVIVFAPSGNGPLYRIPSNGGQAVEVTHLVKPQQSSHRFPQFLPDGRHFLFFVVGTQEEKGVYVGSLDSTEVRRLLDADTAAVFTPPDSVLFGRQETLFAQRVDLTTLKMVGSPSPVADRVVLDAAAGNGAYSASASGPVAYRTVTTDVRQLVWFNRSGKQIGMVGEPDTARLRVAKLSPDSRFVALERELNGNPDVWLVETLRGIRSRFTNAPVRESDPIWSPDGQFIAFTSTRQGLGDIYQKPVGGAGTEELLLKSSESKNTLDWSADGRFILYAVQSAKGARDLWALPLDGDRKPFVVAQTDFEETNGRFSPDVRWVSYESNESGRNEIYVQNFPRPGGKSQLSTNGGTFAQWRGDGREIFYLGADNRVMAVPITLQPNGPAIKPGTPVALFSVRSGSEYMAAPDGQRFLINMPLEGTATAPITVILNWGGVKK
jgi:eukaryotic-like serine/threonine-protein kinase